MDALTPPRVGWTRSSRGRYVRTTTGWTAGGACSFMCHERQRFGPDPRPAGARGVRGRADRPRDVLPPLLASGGGDRGRRRLPGTGQLSRLRRLPALVRGFVCAV